MGCRLDVRLAGDKEHGRNLSQRQRCSVPIQTVLLLGKSQRSLAEQVGCLAGICIQLGQNFSLGPLHLYKQAACDSGISMSSLEPRPGGERFVFGTVERCKKDGKSAIEVILANDREDF